MPILPLVNLFSKSNKHILILITEHRVYSAEWSGLYFHEIQILSWQMYNKQWSKYVILGYITSFAFKYIFILRNNTQNIYHVLWRHGLVEATCQVRDLTFLRPPYTKEAQGSQLSQMCMKNLSCMVYIVKHSNYSNSSLHLAATIWKTQSKPIIPRNHDKSLCLGYHASLAPAGSDSFSDSTTQTEWQKDHLKSDGSSLNQSWHNFNSFWLWQFLRLCNTDGMAERSFEIGWFKPKAELA